jgi:hypothetical protein
MTGVWGAGGVVAGVVTTDVGVVATTGATAGVVVVVVVWSDGATTLGAGWPSLGMEARAPGSLLGEPSTHPAPMSSVTTTAVAIQCRRTNLGMAPEKKRRGRRNPIPFESGFALGGFSTMC